MQNSNFSNRLKLLMTSLNMTQKEFAKFVKIRESTISYWVSGKFTPNQSNLNKIIVSTQVSPSWLMGYGSDDEIKNTVR